MSKRSWSAVALAVVLALVVGGVVLWTQRDDRPRAAVGDQIDDEVADRPSGWATQVQLPEGGELRALVTPALAELPPSCCVDDPVDLRPPDGGSFVGVEVAVTDGLGRLPVREAGVGYPEPEVAVLVEREGLRGPEPTYEEYPVTGSPLTSNGLLLPGSRWSTFVAVDGVPEESDVLLAIDVDGQRQLVDPRDDRIADRGRADRLYTSLDREVGDQRCRRPRAPEGFAFPSSAPQCTVATTVAPYVVGPGWADEGMMWVVAAFGASAYLDLVRTVPDGESYYGVDGDVPRWEATLDGEPADEQFVSLGNDDAPPNAFAWQVPEDDAYGLTVVATATYGLDPSDGFGRYVRDPAPVTSAGIGWRVRL